MENGSSVASGLMLQNSRASPIFGFTERPFLAHWDKSFHHGTELKFALAAGNTVSPPSSTSELHKKKKMKRTIKFLSKIHQRSQCKTIIWKENDSLQVHKNCSNTLATILSVELIKEVIVVRLIFLPYFIVKNLKNIPELIATAIVYISKIKISRSTLESYYNNIFAYILSTDCKSEHSTHE
ncbi:hypothetical protein CR513_21002, partial [Mucuna pruriens]